MWVFLYHLQKKGRKEIEDIVEEIKERDREEKRNRNESEETEEIKTFSLYPFPATRIAGIVQLLANICWTPLWRKIHDTFAPLDQP